MMYLNSDGNTTSLLAIDNFYNKGMRRVPQEVPSCLLFQIKISAFVGETYMLAMISWEKLIIVMAFLFTEREELSMLLPKKCKVVL